MRESTHSSRYECCVGAPYAIWSAAGLCCILLILIFIVFKLPVSPGIKRITAGIILAFFLFLIVLVVRERATILTISEERIYLRRFGRVITEFDRKNVRNVGLFADFYRSTYLFISALPMEDVLAFHVMHRHSKHLNSAMTETETYRRLLSSAISQTANRKNSHIICVAGIPKRVSDFQHLFDVEWYETGVVFLQK